MTYHIIYWFLKLLSTPVFADISGNDSSNNIVIQNPLGEGATLETLLNKVIDFFAYQLGPVIVVAMVILAGYQLITAGGDESKVKSAKNTLTYTVIGYALILIADGAVSIIKSVLGIETSEGKTATDLIGIISNLVDWFFYLTLVIAVGAFIYAAWLFITSSGDAKKQAEAKSIILYAVIGLVVAMLAQGFVLLASQLTGTSVILPNQ